MYESTECHFSLVPSKISKMTLSVKMLKIDEDFNKKGAKQVLVGSSDISPGNSTKKNQNLRKKFFFDFFTPSDPNTYPYRGQYLGL